MGRSTRSIVPAVVLALAATLTSGAAVAAPTAPTCGASVTGHVRLTADLVCDTDVGLHFTGPGVLDLGGHALRGGGTYGVRVDTGAAVEVRHGRVEGWRLGVYAGDDWSPDPTEVRVDRVRFRDNGSAVSVTYATAHVTASRFERNGGGVGAFYGRVTVDGSVFRDNRSGVSAAQGGAVVTRSVFERNETGAWCSEAGLDVTDSQFTGSERAVDVAYCNFSTVTGSTFRHNTTAVATQYMSPDPLISRNRFEHNGTAIHLESGGTIEDNDFRHNGTGIVWEYDVRFEAFVLAIVGNRLSHNGDAIVVPTEAEIGDNTVVRNRGWGIYAPEAIDLGGNVASGNGNEPQCVGVVCRRS